MLVYNNIIIVVCQLNLKIFFNLFFTLQSIIYTLKYCSCVKDKNIV